MKTTLDADTIDQANVGIPRPRQSHRTVIIINRVGFFFLQIADLQPPAKGMRKFLRNLQPSSDGKENLVGAGRTPQDTPWVRGAVVDVAIFDEYSRKFPLQRYRSHRCWVLLIIYINFSYAPIRTDGNTVKLEHTSAESAANVDDAKKKVTPSMYQKLVLEDLTSLGNIDFTQVALGSRYRV